jgi:hypothetical protein
MAGVAAALVLIGACDGAVAVDDEQAVDAGTYAAVIDRFVPAAPASESLRVAFVTAVGDEPLPLDDQVAVIDALADTHDVRFVDQPADAFDPDVADAPPRDDGVLIGVGKISGESPHTVRVEVYSAADQVVAQLVTLSWHDEAWRIDSVEPVEPEVLVADE